MGDWIRHIEQETGTWCLTLRDDDGKNERLLICGHEEGMLFGDTGRRAAERMAKEMFRESRKGGGRDHDSGKGGKGGTNKWERAGDKESSWNSRGGGDSWSSGRDKKNDSWQGHGRDSNDKWREHGRDSNDKWRGRGRDRSRTPPRCKGGNSR